MNALPETSRVIFDKSSIYDFGAGLHTTERQRPGDFGALVGYENFDPARHRIDQIDHTSELEDVFDVPQVQIVLPYNRLNLNVMLNIGNEPTLPKYLQEVIDGKLRLTTNLTEALVGAKQIGDRARLLVMGETVQYAGLPSAVNVPTRDGSSVQRTIQDQAGRAFLNFWVSGFSGVDPNVRVPKTVAVKANHPLELELPPNVGIVSLGGLKECDTDKPKQLKATNKELSERHEEALKKLASMGLTIVEVVYDSSHALGFDSKKLDRELAKAVRAVK
jgi:hypothetical protein